VTQQLTDMEIDRADLVDRGANGRRFALFKRDPDAAPLELGEGWVAKLTGAIGSSVAKALGIPEPVAKVMTFAERVAGEEMSDALEEHWTTLQDSLWSAIYAYDDEGNALSLDAKKQLAAQNLDEFKAFLLERMDQGVTKADGSVEVRLLEAFVAKVGRKASAARVARLQEAADALGAVLAEVAADVESAETEKRANPQEEDVTPDEIKAAVSEVVKAELAPIRTEIEALKTAAAADPDPEKEPATLEGVTEAIGKLADRIGAMETSRGTRQSAASDEATPVKKSRWAGVLG
jgi:hypothetical protein